MPPWPNVLAFGLAALILVLVPGPSVLFVLGRSLALGRAGGLLSVVGNTLGLVPHLLAVSLGLGALVAASAGVFAAVKVVGAGYLIYLGGQAIRRRHHWAIGFTGAAASSRRRIVGQALLVGVSNPKTIVFFVAVLPQFVAYDQGAVWLQLLVLGSVFLVIALACDSGWALAAGTVRDRLARTPRRLAGLRTTGGVLMIGLGGLLAASSRSS